MPNISRQEWAPGPNPGAPSQGSTVEGDTIGLVFMGLLVCEQA